MRNRNRMIAAAAAVAAVLAAGSGAAVASTSGGKPNAPAPTVSASKTPTVSDAASTQTTLGWLLAALIPAGAIGAAVVARLAAGRVLCCARWVG